MKNILKQSIAPLAIIGLLTLASGASWQWLSARNSTSVEAHPAQPVSSIPATKNIASLTISATSTPPAIKPPPTNATSTPPTIDPPTKPPPTNATSTPPTIDPPTKPPPTNATSTPPTIDPPTKPPPTNATSTPPTTATHRAQIDFGAPVGDAYLGTLLERHDAKLTVAYMTTAGFYGAHRAATSTAPALFIARARAETILGFSNGAGDGMTTRAREFVATYTSQDVTEDTDVEKHANSLIDLHAQLEDARVDATSGSPLIHAVEVSGAEANLRLLGAERGVVGFQIASIGSDVRWGRPPLAGGASGQIDPPAGPSGAADDSGTLYDRLSTLAERKLEGAE